MHWGFMIKDDDFDKYQPELDKMDAFYSCDSRPSTSYEVRGHLHETGRRQGHLSPSCPTRSLPTRQLARRQGRAAAEEAAGDEEDDRSRSHKNDIERCGQPAARLRHLLRHLLHSSPACTRCTSSAASSS